MRQHCVYISYFDAGANVYEWQRYRRASDKASMTLLRNVYLSLRSHFLLSFKGRDSSEATNTTIPDNSLRRVLTAHASLLPALRCRFWLETFTAHQDSCRRTAKSAFPRFMFNQNVKTIALVLVKNWFLDLDLFVLAYSCGLIVSQVDIS